jgi:hypothetical protein
VGTIGATTAAIYYGGIREWRRRPKLTLKFELGTADAVEVPTTKEGELAAFLRLRVRNESGRATADDVEVTISSAREMGDKPREVDLDGRLLPYSNTDPPVVRLHLPPGAERHVDLAYVLFTAQGLLPGTTRPVVFAVHPRPVDERLASMTEGGLNLELTIAARNVDAVRFGLELHFAGDVDEDRKIIERLQIRGLRGL